MPAQEKSDLFEFMLERVKETQNKHLDGELTYANYFRAQSNVSRMLKRGLPGEIKRCARAALKS